ncbi:MAG: dienelactone hydrolase, partial [Glaciecola sp.]
MPITSPSRPAASASPCLLSATGRRRRAFGAFGALVGLLTAGLAPAALAQRASSTSAGATGEASAGVGPSTWTVTATTLDVLTGPDDDIPVTLDLDVYLPSSATTTNPAPAMLHTHGFGGDKANGESVANAEYFASKGYVVITHSTQGFGGSTGCIGLDSTDYDAKNVAKIVDLLATMPEVATNGPGDPKVGLLGGSYGGGLQGGAAYLDSRIDAISIGRSWNALQYSLVPNNWVLDPEANMYDLIGHEQGVFKQQWTTMFFGVGSAAPAQNTGGCDPFSQQLAYPGAVPCSGFIPEICPIYASLTSTGNTLAGQREVIFKTSIANYIDQVNAPTMLVQGMPDTLFTPTEAAATYTALKKRGVPSTMIWHNGGHGGYNGNPGEAEAYNGSWVDRPSEFANAYLPRRTLQWFEKYVRGEASLD